MQKKYAKFVVISDFVIIFSKKDVIYILYLNKKVVWRIFSTLVG